MELHNKVKRLREINDLSQEDMAEKLNVSKNTYGRLERGEVKISLDRLRKIADIFNIDLSDILKQSEQGLTLLITSGDSSHNNYYSSNYKDLISENESLKLALSYKDEIIIQKDKEIALLRKLIESKDP